MLSVVSTALTPLVSTALTPSRCPSRSRALRLAPSSPSRCPPPLRLAAPRASVLSNSAISPAPSSSTVLLQSPASLPTWGPLLSRAPYAVSAAPTTFSPPTTRSAPLTPPSLATIRLMTPPSLLLLASLAPPTLSRLPPTRALYEFRRAIARPCLVRRPSSGERRLPKSSPASLRSKRGTLCLSPLCPPAPMSCTATLSLQSNAKLTGPSISSRRASSPTGTRRSTELISIASLPPSSRLLHSGLSSPLPLRVITTLLRSTFGRPTCRRLSTKISTCAPRLVSTAAAARARVQAAP